MKLATLQKSIALPGAMFHANRLEIAPNATTEQLNLIGGFLGSVRDAQEWWQADYIKAKSAHARQDPGIEQSSFDFYLSVADMFPASLRVEGLSFEHHKEALIGTSGSAVEARQWLAKAHAEGWSVPELRKALRIANATYAPDNLKRTGNGYSALTDAERWARTQEKSVNTYTPERARAVLSDIAHLRGLIAKLEAIAAS